MQSVAIDCYEGTVHGGKPRQRQTGFFSATTLHTSVALEKILSLGSSGDPSINLFTDRIHPPELKLSFLASKDCLPRGMCSYFIIRVFANDPPSRPSQDAVTDLRLFYQPQNRLAQFVTYWTFINTFGTWRDCLVNSSEIEVVIRALRTGGYGL